MLALSTALRPQLHRRKALAGLRGSSWLGEPNAVQAMTANIFSGAAYVLAMVACSVLTYLSIFHNFP
jgi:hypothetical protein